MAREAPQIKRGMTRWAAEAHWEFIRRLLELENDDGMVQIDTVGYLYVEAMLHGAKHERKG